MKRALWLAMVTAAPMLAQSSNMQLPKNITAGSGFSIPTTATVKATLYIVGPGQALKRDVQPGETISFHSGDLYSAGHYVAILESEGATDSGEFDVTPAEKPQALGFLAKPSRLPVGLHNGISGAIYVFDAYSNLITRPMPASLELTASSGAPQSRTLTTRNGLAWTAMDSASKEGRAKLVARVGEISSTRVIEEVPGDPCSISISARPEGGKLQVETPPVRDCSGNPIPDGTIVTFTETYNGTVSTADVPLKQGVASVAMPAIRGANLSVSCGVVAGNEIKWDGGR
ncbi:MAG TPA: hypothetical protein VGD64_01130 [Acidisarcina sp.]